MGIFRQFPYTNFHDLNLDWLIETVKEWVLKTDQYFINNDEAIEWLTENFDELKNYVVDTIENFFTEAHIEELISDKMDQMLEDGDFDEILGNRIITWDDVHVAQMNGRAVMRTRHNYQENPASIESGARHTSMQNGIVYSPTNNYSINSTDTILYYLEVWSDNVGTSLHAYDLYNKRETANVGIGDGHGGGMAIKNNKLYHIDTTTNKLKIFDISTPTTPNLETERDIALEGTYLMGWDDFNNRWLCAEAQAQGSGRRVFGVNENFTSEEYLYRLETLPTIINQDYSYDPDTKRIYQMQTWPNLITMIDAITGKTISNYSMPEHISYICTGECEFISAHGEHIYWGTITNAGAPCSMKQERIVFYTNPRIMQETRKINTSNAGTRTFRVDNTLDGLNRPYAALGGNNLKFAYVEDAFNAIKELGVGIVSFDTDYEYSFTISANCRLNLNSHNIRAFKTDPNIDVYITGINSGSFSGEPIRYEYTRIDRTEVLSCMIYLQHGTNAKFNQWTGRAKPNNADVLIWANTASVHTCEGGYIHDILLTNSEINGTGLIGKNFFARYSVINCSFDLEYASTQFIDEYCTVIANAFYGDNRRVELNQILGKRIPAPMLISMGTGRTVGGKPLPQMECYRGGIGGGAGTSTISWGYWSGTNYEDYNQVRLDVTKSLTYQRIGVFNAIGYTTIEQSGYTIPSNVRSFVGVAQLLN